MFGLSYVKIKIIAPKNNTSNVVSIVNINKVRNVLLNLLVFSSGISIFY